MSSSSFQASEEAKKHTFDAIHDTEAYVCANDDMVAVVFRGTKEKVDWVTNLNACKRGCPPEWGFPNLSGTMHEVRGDHSNFCSSQTSVQPASREGV